MKYRELNGYKYMLMETISFYVGIFPSGQLDATDRDGFLRLTPKGFLTITKGYCWDGATDPAVDTKNIMTPSLVHDAGYQLIRLGLIPRHTKDDWDNLLKSMCNERGMSGLRQSWVHLGVDKLGGGAIRPNAKDLIQIIELL